MIISPCISICKTDPLTGYCYGCGRSNDDKKMWKDEKTSDMWKKNNLEEAKKRLNGWQLKSFEESYKYKVENGISLIKKKNLKGPNLEELLVKLNNKPNDINTILALADKYFASDMIDEAFSLLLSNYKNHKEKIKIKLINFFEALGNTNLKTIEYRKKFSSIMFS